MSVPHYNDTITELAVKSLVVQLLEDLFKVARKIHDPIKKERKREDAEELKSKSTEGAMTREAWGLPWRSSG